MLYPFFCVCVFAFVCVSYVTWWWVNKQTGRLGTCDELEKLRYTIQVAIRCVLCFFYYIFFAVVVFVAWCDEITFCFCHLFSDGDDYVICRLFWLLEESTTLRKKKVFCFIRFYYIFSLHSSNGTNEWRGYIDARIFFFLLLFVLYPWVFYFIFIIILVLQRCHSCLFKESEDLCKHTRNKSILEDLNLLFFLHDWVIHSSNGIRS